MTSIEKPKAYFCRSLTCMAEVGPNKDFCSDCSNPSLLDDAFPEETDPNGVSAHTPGAKLDAGKVRADLVLGGFARALWAVSEIGTFGAIKYTANGWMEVADGPARYGDAQMRHWLKLHMGQATDPDTQKTHLAHEAWNALARLDLHLRKEEKPV